MEHAVAGRRVAGTGGREGRSGDEQRIALAWDALAEARHRLFGGDVRSAAGAVEAALSVATQALLKSRGLPPTTHADLGTSRAACEIVLGSPAGRLAECACELAGLGMYPAELLGARDLEAARSALNSSAALVALIESEVCR
ncbi:MAG: hypothetical protein ACYC77_09510 [Coriobacteriia bacterium]